VRRSYGSPQNVRDIMQKPPEEISSFYEDLKKLLNSKEKELDTLACLLAQFSVKYTKSYNPFAALGNDWDSPNAPSVSQELVDLRNQFRECNESLDEIIESLRRITEHLVKGEKLL
jgi:hypothetical protein